MTKISLRVGCVVALCAAVMMGGAVSASAQVSAADQACIVAFNKGIRRVAKEQGKIIKKCLRNYASGNLVAMTPEDCMQSDPSGKLQQATDKAIQIINLKCAGGLPGFGTSTVNPALVTAVLGQSALMHGVITNDLDTGLMTTPGGASCQAQTAAALLKCSDTRIKDYLKCQKQGLRAGTITDAVSLSAACLGTGASPQPDSNGHIAFMCGTKLSGKISQHCGGTALFDAFPLCNTSDVTLLTTCLRAESACRLCEVLTEVDGITRDCDLMDDGDGVNGSCGAECGDSVLQVGESCDDGDQTAGDGCSTTCSVEGGWTCTGEPSVCTQNCGNGALDAGELCDDGDTANGDGCSNACTVEAGWGCSGEPSVCERDCGNGTLQGGEACDDDDEVGGDGCSSTCQIEPGYNCSGQPSVCTFVCGNGTFQAGETCDDGDAFGNDGCSGVCQIEAGWLCSGQPSLCAPLCGDGLTRGPEACDDGNVSNGDGCAFNCQVESGFQCVGTPSSCAPICGDGFIRGLETCDDGDTSGGDGCAGSPCLQESGYTCTGQPSVCVLNCGDGNIDVPEECDDGDNDSSDGCSSGCVAEAGYACGGQPSVCSPTCGNSILNVSETCDDGNIANGDGCTSSCRNEPGWLCLVPGTACVQFEIFIDSPVNGTFTTGSTSTITGHYTTLLPGTASVTINGVPASFVNPVLRTFSHTVSLSAANIFNPVRATVAYIPTGDDTHDRIVVIRGDSVPDGMHSLQSVGMRINDTGLNQIEPLVGALAAGQFNLADLLPAGTVMADECFIDSFLGCLGSARVTIANPPPSFSNLTLGMDSITNAVVGDIDIFNLRIDINIDGSGLVPDCGLRLTASALQLLGNYALEPAPGNPSSVDVNLVGPLNVSFSGFNHTFTSGLCDAPIIGDIIQAFLPDIQQFALDGISGFMSDPDGAGPADSPIADGIETVLEGISIAGPVGAGVGLMLDTPLFKVAEDNTGITFGSDSRFQVSIGSGPGQCIPPPGAPDFSRSYSKPEVFPTFGPNTPLGGVPYGLGIGISTAGFNQLLRGQTECGLMRTSLTTIDLDGPGGSPPLALTSTLLSLLVPEFGLLPAATPMRIDVAPTLAPIVTGNTGPAGELTELKIAHVQIDIVEVSNSKVWMRGYLDGRLGMDLAFLPDGSGLAITIATPAASDLTIAIIGNPLGANEATVETVLPAIIRPLIPSLAGALSGFPLPAFFGLQVQGLEVSRQGQFLSLFANLAPAP